MEGGTPSALSIHSTMDTAAQTTYKTEDEEHVGPALMKSSYFITYFNMTNKMSREGKRLLVAVVDVPAVLHMLPLLPPPPLPQSQRRLHYVVCIK